MKEFSDNIINKTDLDFFRYCQGQYGINRGVYNTIENWFYNKKIEEITVRRKYVLQFLQFVYGDQKGTGKLGKGKVSDNLHQFWSTINNHAEIIK
ncbi:hypothetical protein [Alkalihalobacillus sp. 1P02AB]|uniref:hypothetical protein n=1 Tax=Alkalihalobacillus sp. 1P02AB TaxID=3132260 RepID=UPI0039A5977C